MMRNEWGVRSLISGAATFLLSAACGGASSQPQAANEQEYAAAPPAEVSPVEAEQDAPSDEETMDSSVPPASSEDLEAALQVVLQDEALKRELKLEEPGRFPVKISGPDWGSSLKLQVATEAVEVVPEPEDPKTVPVLIFTEVNLNSKEGMFKYRYDIEGVRGTSYVVKGPSGWELKSSRVSGY